jgi:DNA-binding NarL/FixJ family response regulator
MSNVNLSLPMAARTITITCRYGDLQLTRTPASEPVLISPADAAVPLSPRQAQVLRLLVQGLSNKEIARILGLGVGTVKIHVAALFHKLGVTSRTAAAVAGTRLLGAPSSPEGAPERREVSGSYPFGSSLASAA